jgi:predicted O-methyltransferase YrrM
MSAVGTRRLEAMQADGLPSFLVEPNRFLLLGTLSPADRAIVTAVENLRSALGSRTELFEVCHPTKVGDLSIAQDATSTRTAQWIAHRSSITQQWGTFLYLLGKSVQAKSILELGSCAGISGAYLASVPSVQKLITVEGAPALAGLAKENIESVSDRAIVINAMFDAALDDVLQAGQGSFDLFFIDGEHTRAARLHYMKRIEPLLRDGSVIVFDDIHYSEELWKAWHELRAWPGVSHSLNAGRLGVCIWSAQRTGAKHFDISRLAGWLRIGGRRWKLCEELRFRRAALGASR